MHDHGRRGLLLESGLGQVWLLGLALMVAAPKLWAQSAPAPAVSNIGPNGAPVKNAQPQLPAQPQAMPQPQAELQAASQPQASQPQARYPRLEKRFDSADQPASRLNQQAAGMVLPAGTPIPIRLETELSSGDDRAGGSFAGRVTRDIYMNGQLAIPEGSILEGRVLRVRDRSPLHGRSEMLLDPDYLRIPGGRGYVLSAGVASGQQVERGKVGREGTIRGQRGPTKRDEHHAMLAGGAGLAAGVLLAGGEGALIGTGVGAAAVGGLYLLRPRHLKLPMGTRLVIKLNRQLALR